MRCIRCNRSLTSQESILRGCGPFCWARIQEDLSAGGGIPFVGWTTFDKTNHGNELPVKDQGASNG